MAAVTVVKGVPIMALYQRVEAPHQQASMLWANGYFDDKVEEHELIDPTVHDVQQWIDDLGPIALWVNLTQREDETGIIIARQVNPPKNTDYTVDEHAHDGRWQGFLGRLSSFDTLEEAIAHVEGVFEDSRNRWVERVEQGEFAEAAG